MSTRCDRMHRGQEIQSSARRYAPPVTGDRWEGFHPEHDASLDRSDANPRVSDKIAKRRLHMNDGFMDASPALTPQVQVTADQVLHGPSVPPQQRIQLYSADEWEGCGQEWAHLCLRPGMRRCNVSRARVTRASTSRVSRMTRSFLVSGITINARGS